MSDQIKSQQISRREALFFVGLAASLAAPAVITPSDAEAQQQDKEDKKKERQEKREQEKKEKKEKREQEKKEKKEQKKQQKEEQKKEQN